MLAAVGVDNKKSKQSLQLTCLSLQIQNSPLKTLLEIIVKHHTEGVKSDMITRNKGDCLQSLQTINSTATSPAGTSTLMNETEAGESTVANVVSKHTKLRYYASNAFDTLLC